MLTTLLKSQSRLPLTVNVRDLEMDWLTACEGIVYDWTDNVVEIHSVLDPMHFRIRQYIRRPNAVGHYVNGAANLLLERGVSSRECPCAVVVHRGHVRELVRAIMLNDHVRGYTASYYLPVGYTLAFDEESSLIMVLRP